MSDLWSGPYPLLPAELAAQLAAVPTSADGGMTYAPCQVTLADGTARDRVYVVEATAFLAHWGLDPQRPAISIADVAAIEDSPTRLPAPLADKVYAVGESGMGYVLLTVVMRDGSRLPFLMGNAVDFPDWPPGVDPRDAVDVLPGEAAGHKRSKERDRLAKPVWCLYSR